MRLKDIAIARAAAAAKQREQAGGDTGSQENMSKEDKERLMVSAARAPFRMLAVPFTSKPYYRTLIGLYVFAYNGVVSTVFQ